MVTSPASCSLRATALGFPSRQRRQFQTQTHLPESMSRIVAPSHAISEAEVTLRLGRWSGVARFPRDPDDGINQNCYNSRDIFPGTKVNSLRLSYSY